MRERTKNTRPKQKLKANRPPDSSGWPVAYRWAATGALIAYTAVGARTVSPAFAQTHDPGGTQRSQPVGEAPRVYSFAIAAGPLRRTLREFTQITGVKTQTTTAEIGEVQVNPVQGEMTAEEALQSMLADTQVRFRAADSRVVTLDLFGPVTQVEVRAAPEPRSIKYTEPLRNTPQTVTVIDSEMIAQQGATSLRDVLANVTGLTVVAGEGGTPAGDNLTLRGFSARNDIFVDGVRDLGPQSRDAFNLEQVEVVKGPQSTFTGRGSAGGSINLISKSASLQPHAELGLAVGTANAKRVTADVNTLVPFLGDRTAFRVNLMGHDAGVPGRNAVKNSRYGLAPTFSFGLGSPTRYTLGYSRLEQNNISDYGIPWVPASNNVLAEYRDQPAPAPRETFYGFADRDKEKMGADTATLRFEHDFSDSLLLRNQFRYGRTTRDSIATPPRFDSPDTTQIRREMRSWITEDEIFDNQADVRADLGHGAVRHSLVAGVALTREGNIRKSRSAPNALTTLLNPDPNDVYTGEFTPGDTVGDVSADTQAVYAFDTVKLGRRLQLTGGLRAERFAVDGVTLQGDPLDRTQTLLNARAGIVYAAADSGSFYASYGTSQNPSLEGLSYVGRRDDPNLDPEKTYTVEGGTKWDLARNRLLVSAAVFQVDKTNARTPGILPDDPPQILDGRQRVRGVELGATGHLTATWTLFAGYTQMSSKIVESNNESEVGNRFPQAPPQSFNLWSTYEFPWRISLGGGLRYVGRRYSNTSNARFVDGYWTADAMASVPIGEKVSLRLNLTNLTNEYFFDRLGGGHVVPGPSRALLGSLNFRF